MLSCFYSLFKCTYSLQEVYPFLLGYAFFCEIILYISVQVVKINLTFLDYSEKIYL